MSSRLYTTFFICMSLVEIVKLAEGEKTLSPSMNDGWWSWLNGGLTGTEAQAPLSMSSL
jgi:uncharacterized membrane protein